MQAIQDKIKDDDSVIRKLLITLTRMSFIKKLKESLDDKFHEFLPEESQLNEPNLVHIGEAKDNPDALMILDKITSKEPATAIREALVGDSVGQPTDLMKEIFVECILSRARKSLEHLKRFVEIYFRDILQPFFLGEYKQNS